MRIVGHPGNPNSPGSPAIVAEILSRLRALPGHRFWSDDISLLAFDGLDAAKLMTSAQVTDTYLLALAKRHGGRLATFDRRLSVAAVVGGKSFLHQIENAPAQHG